MTRFILAVLVISLCRGLHAEGWNYPNLPSTAIGDPGNFYLVGHGLHLGVLNDDFLGGTDKLMTGSSFLSFFSKLSGSDQRSFTYEISANRRLFTPITKTHFRTKEIVPVQGLFADELEARFDMSWVRGAFKFEAGTGLESYGHYGGPEVHDFVHHIVVSPNELGRFGHALDRNYPTASLGMGAIISRHLLWMTYGVRSSLMSSVLTRLSFKTNMGPVLMAMQMEGAYSLASDLYSSIKPWRWGGGLSFRYHWYQITVNYQSIYLQYDRYGQYFLSPIVLHFEF